MRLVAAFLVCTGERQRTLSEDVRLLQMTGQHLRLPEGETTQCLRDDHCRCSADDLPLPGLDLPEPLTQRGQFPLSIHQRCQHALDCHVKARPTTARPDHLKDPHRGPALHRHLAQIARFEEASDVLLRGGAITTLPG
jgi:hypothetical protein